MTRTFEILEFRRDGPHSSDVTVTVSVGRLVVHIELHSNHYVVFVAGPYVFVERNYQLISQSFICLKMSGNEQ